jgi:hypothetical protein
VTSSSAERQSASIAVGRQGVAWTVEPFRRTPDQWSKAADLERSMSYTRNIVEATRFKAVPGGYVFRMPNPWLFGKPDHYLVSEAQKTELLAILTPRRPALRIFLAFVLVALAGSAMVFLLRTFGSGQNALTVGDHMIMVAVALVAVAAANAIDRIRGRRRVERITAQLPRTNEAISYCDRHHAMLGATPFRLKVTMLLVSGLLSAMQLRSWSSDADPVAAVGAIVFGLLALHEAFTLVQKLRGGRPSA